MRSQIGLETTAFQVKNCFISKTQVFLFALNLHFKSNVIFFFNLKS